MLSKTNLRKSLPTSEETSKLMQAREVYRECGKDQNVCVVIPDDKTVDQVFDNYHTVMKGRLSRSNVSIVYYSQLTEEDIECNNLIIDLSMIHKSS